jgi:hypothetical protein
MQGHTPHGMARKSKYWRHNMTAVVKQMTLFAPELEARSALSASTAGIRLKILTQSNVSKVEHTQNLFIAISATGLSDIASIIKRANDIKLLRALFVRENVAPEWLPQMLSRADLRMARNILIHANEDWQTPRRIINAWRLGAQRDLIARASATDETLLVINCALECFEVPFSKIPVLVRMPRKELSKFRLSESGSYIHWTETDVHLDLEAIRYATDDNWRQQYDLEKITHNKQFGKAIGIVRQKYGLEKKDITVVSERQLRRIENEGARPSISTLTALATAHEMELNTYLNEIAKHF